MGVAGARVGVVLLPGVVSSVRLDLFPLYVLYVLEVLIMEVS